MNDINDLYNLSFADVETALDMHGRYISRTSGRSMEPLLRTGRDAIILECPTEALRCYDVVLYKIGGKYILHRIIRIKNDGKMLCIRGDNTFITEYVPSDKVIARLVGFVRAGKRHEVTDLSYRIYSRLWCAIYPVRYTAYKVRRALGRLWHKLFRNTKR